MEDKDRSEEIEMKERERAKEESRKQDQETSFNDRNEEDQQERGKRRRARVDEAVNKTGGGGGTTTADVLIDDDNVLPQTKSKIDISKAKAKITKDFERANNVYRVKSYLEQYTLFDNYKGNAEDGPASKEFFETVEANISKDGLTVLGLKVDGEPVTKFKSGKAGEITYSESARSKVPIQRFKKLLAKAQQEYKKNVRSTMNEAAGVNLPPEAVNSIKTNVSEKINKKVKARVNKLDPGASTSKNQNQTSALTEQEIREFRGVLRKGSRLKEISQERSDQMLKSLEVDRVYWENKSKEDGISKAQKETYEAISETVKLKMDDIRVKSSLKPVTEEVTEMVKEEAKENVLTKFEQFKEWAKTLGKYGAYAVALGSVITSIVVNAKLLLRKTQNGFDKFKEMLQKFADKAGPVVKVILQAAGAILAIMAKGAEFLAKYIWLLFVAIAFVVYSEFKSYREYRRSRAQR